MTSPWTFRPWRGDSPRALRAGDLLHAEPKKVAAGSRSIEFLPYADEAYVTARFMLLADCDLYLPGLYFVGQAVEKYMKALLLDHREKDRLARLFDPTSAKRAPLAPLKKRLHDLKALAQDIGAVHSEFKDAEFIEVCSRLTSFEVLGRYPDHAVESWGYSRNIIAFLDKFVVHCRQLLQVDPRQDRADLIHILLTSGSPDSLGICGLVLTLAEENDFLPELCGCDPEIVAEAIAHAKTLMAQA